tara:strand:+ start:3257 stop:3607 length:351 start_codon:yes stop_codon:yes gene_type:complete
MGCSSSAPVEHIWELTIKDDAVIGKSELETKQGDSITFEVTGNVNGSIHLHGYDIEIPFDANSTNFKKVQLNATGIFNLALHFEKVDDHDHDHDHDHESNDETEEKIVGRLRVNPN